MTVNRPHNDVFLRALAQQDVPYTPIWLMRQAGRYLPEYRALRQQAGSFMNLCRNPALAAEVTLQPLARFPLDAAIVFSDILTIPDAMGLGLNFVAGEGPMFSKPLRDEAAIYALPIPDPTCELRYVLDAVSHSRRALANKVPLIGFAGSPYTLACYMIEGAASRDFTAAKGLLYQRPDLMHHLLEVLSQAIILYLNAQIEAGAQVVMLFDSWGGNLSPSTYQTFSLAYMQRIIAGLTKERDGQAVPSIMFTRGGGLWLESMAQSGCSALGLDWQTDLGQARKRVGNAVALQGNLDPSALLGSPASIVSEAQRIMQSHAAIPGHIFNLGHGVLQQTPIEHIALLVEAVQGFGKKSS